MTGFFEKLNRSIAQNSSLLVVGIDPNPEMMPGGDPSSHSHSIEALGDWLRTIIEQTADHVCAYKPSLGFYQALGAPGFELLQQVLQEIPPHLPIIIDAKHSDLNTATALAHTLFQDWDVDAVTLSPFAGQDAIAPFLLYGDKASFIVCRTSNPAARIIQDYPQGQLPFYQHLVQEARTWGSPEQLGFEIGTSTPESLAQIRALAPERMLLARSIWGDTAPLEDFLRAGLDASGNGLLLPVPQDWLRETNLPEKLQTLNHRVSQVRQEVSQTAASCQLWTAPQSAEPHPHRDLILQLFDLECILFGDYVQASGDTFAYYIDLRKIISNPQVFHQVLNAYAEILENLVFDRIAGIPYGSLPTATGLSLRLHHPMIFPRKEVKAHGTRRLIEGEFHAGETVVVVDDILISGKSAIEGAQKLESAGLNVKDIVVLIDHEKGVKTRLKNQGYQAHSVLQISGIAHSLYNSGRITESQLEVLLHDQASI
ncbi:bifunctional orotidine-5'-phosphate decarboxylase/orotate phosphoribosyltransferase [Sodalinema gerasimenkoae]|uniref:bifunctional orotidine-5'-phosphate decarboxylase/orotate phosphoribosyltransferase n=1 Tax=Sodalinema gerasimenkoae TaxID=2862348 RepID=UPI00135B449B|nr:bifunctional orotidine-5'-phosphate decarboxylase/orotate phosphoribosyltransferase [Sodalinema gerasimenkoae]